MSLKVRLYHLAIALPILFNSAGALAQQSDKGTTAGTLTQPREPALPYPPPGQVSQGYLFNLRPLGADIGQSLAAQGIYMTGYLSTLVADHAAGGLRTGVVNQGYDTFGFDFDLNRIANIQGGSFHFLIDSENGSNSAKYSGTGDIVPRALLLKPLVRLDEFSYEQSLLNGKVDVRVGRIPVGQEFDASELYCQYLTGLCGTPIAWGFDKGYPAYVEASTAAVARFDLSNSYYFRAAAYEDEPLLGTNGHGGWPGPDWDPKYFRGVTFPMQLGYRTNFTNDTLPRAYDIGAFVDTGNYNDPILNTAGANRVLFKGTTKVDHGKSQIWLQAQQMVWRPDLTSERGITIFGAANFSTSGQATFTNGLLVGASWRGPFESRPNDRINVVGQTVRLNTGYVTNVNSQLQLRGISGRVGNSESYVEANYNVALAPGVSLQPFFSYIFNPDQNFQPTPVVATNTHAVVFGLALSASIPETFGLPRLSRPGY